MKRIALLPLASLTLAACQEATRPDVEGPIATPQFAIAAVVGTETQITTDPAQQVIPAISGDRIVWRDRRNGLSDVYMFDLATGTETQITTDPAHDQEPDISGDRIVYDRNADIYMFDLAMGTETQITTDAANQFRPAISGDLIVWEDNRNSNGFPRDIFMFDLATGTETPISTDPADERFVAISGSRIVWGRPTSGGRSDIFMFDLATGTETQITIDPPGQDPTDQLTPAISGDRIVWRDHRTVGNIDVYMFDLSTGTETRITTDPGSDLVPAISGDLIVYVRQQHIYMFDLSTGVETQITTEQQLINGGPDISGNRIVWADSRTGSFDIFMFEIFAGSVPNIEFISEQVDRFVAIGCIANRGISEVLNSLLDQTAAKLDRGNDNAAANTLQAFIKFVTAQSGHHIEPDCAQALIDLAQGVIDGLG